MSHRFTPAGMGRRGLMRAAAVAPWAAAGLASPGQAHSNAQPSLWRRFEITTRIALAGHDRPLRLWVPVAQTAGGYQVAHAPSWRTNADSASVVHDREYGAPILVASWTTSSSAPATLHLVQEVATRNRGDEKLLPVTETDRQFWLRPTESIPTDGIVRETAERIVAGRNTPHARLRALYDWVVDHTFRDPHVRGCGLGDVKAMLASGRLGGKCADINSLMTGLARAAGLPARDVYGIRVAESGLYKTLGAAGDISTAQHCRTEVYLDGTGWFPLDPADVRKVVLAENLPMDSAAVRRLRERMFGAWEMNWIGYNSATDIALPGATQRPEMNFLMYPAAMTAIGQPDCLDPPRFRYGISSRALTHI